MEDKFLCVMATYDAQTEKILSDLQEKLYVKGFVGQHTKGIPMHVTLGGFPVDEEEKVKKLVQKVAKEMKPFDVIFNHIGIFEGGKVLFVEPNTTRELIALKEGFGQDASWTPHTTLLIDEPPTINDAVPVVIENFKSFKGTIEGICLYEFWPTRFICSEKIGE